jgi:hypothetical protein
VSITDDELCDRLLDSGCQEDAKQPGFDHAVDVAQIDDELTQPSQARDPSTF